MFRLSNKLFKRVISRNFSLPTNENLRPFYVLGLNLGTQFGQEAKKLLSYEEIEAVLAGFNDFMTDKVVDQHVMMQQYGPGLNAILQGRIDAHVAALESQKDLFLNEYFQEFPNAVKTSSGLVYNEIVTGTGETPTIDSVIRVHYHGKFLDGKVFDSSINRGEPASFPLKNVIQGWQEGLLLMKVGGKAQIVIPSELAYGTNGAPPTIPPNSTLFFDVELLALEN